MDLAIRTTTEYALRRIKVTSPDIIPLRRPEYCRVCRGLSLQEKVLTDRSNPDEQAADGASALAAVSARAVTPLLFAPDMTNSPARLIGSFMLSSARCSVIALAVALAAAAVSAEAQATLPPPLFPPLSLRVVLDSVAAQYPLVLAAQARIRAAQGSRISAGAFSNPVVGYQVDDNVDNVPLAGGGSMRGLEREDIATVLLPLEPLYQRGAQVRRANAEVRAATNDAVATRQRAELAATRAFYRTALAQVGVATARDLMVWLDSIVVYNRSRVKEGVAAEADLIRSEVERDRVAADVTMQDAELARARADLSTFIGVSSPAAAGVLSVATDERPFALPQELLRELPQELPSYASSTPVANATNGVALQAQALGGRAEVRAARDRVAATTAGISSARTMILRQLSVTLGTKRTAGTTSMIAGLSLPIPLFDPNRGEIARATAERDAAAFELAAQERSVSAEVSGAYQAARLLTDRATTMAGGTKSFLARAEEARQIALGAYREGAVPLIQVIDAARAWDESRLAYYRLLYAQHESVLALVVAQGTNLLATLPALTPLVTPNR